jgi:uncharacterized protein YecE (DUF72 family)
MPVLVGTSGWQYDDWRGVLYPAGLPRRAWLSYYFTQFRTLEVNATFYRLPTEQTVTGWAAAAPDDAVFAVKASRFLTHVRRLADPVEPVTRMESVLAPLGHRLGPVLLQLPPTLPAAPQALDEVLAAFPAGRRVALEPRHPSWFTPPVREILAAHDAALVWADRRGRPTGPLWRTASWGFVRLHEGTARPAPSYGPTALRSWSARIRDAWTPSHDVYVYFNNDANAAAVRNAATFARLTARAGWPVSRTPRRLPRPHAPAAGPTRL